MIPTGELNVYAPRIAPNRDFIVFFSDIDDNLDIYGYDLSGKKLLRLTCHGALDAYPVFSDDGRRIYFHSNRDGSYQIYCIDLDVMNDKQGLLSDMEACLAQF